MTSLPPLDCLRFFEAAGRHESFSRAADDLGVTPAAVAHRIRTLEQHLGDTLFDRRRRSVVLNPRGRAYLGDVQRILTDIRDASERHRDRAGQRSLRIVSLEGFAQEWLMPRLIGFKTVHPDIAINLETHDGNIDPAGRDFDCWITMVAPDAPPIHRVPETPVRDDLFEEPFVPFCSPTLIQTRGWPSAPADLLDWPLLYHLGWEGDWRYWFARHGAPPPDLSRASGFRVYSMIVRTAAEGLGVAVGCPSMIAGELDRGTLVPLLDTDTGTALQWRLLTHIEAQDRTEVTDFRMWILQHAHAADDGEAP